MFKLRIPNPKLPARYVFSALVITLATTTYLEAGALKRAEPKPAQLTCLQCHTDKKTLAAIADKSGDDLYLVHNGELTLQQLQALQSGKDSSAQSSSVKGSAPNSSYDKSWK